MTAEVLVVPGNVYVFRISDVLKRAEFDTAQRELARNIAAGASPRLLVILERFEGWEHVDGWADIDLFTAYGHKIAKIALVSESRWEAEVMAFAGAGYRSTPVRFFLPADEPRARAWLDE